MCRGYSRGSVACAQNVRSSTKITPKFIASINFHREVVGTREGSEGKIIIFVRSA